MYNTILYYTRVFGIDISAYDTSCGYTALVQAIRYIMCYYIIDTTHDDRSTPFSGVCVFRVLGTRLVTE